MGASGRDFCTLKRKGEGETNFFSTFEYYGMRMGCLKFPFCSHERTDLRTKNKNHMEDGTG